jgi:Bacterial regulatory helix-turn-helix protein, lysR family
MSSKCSSDRTERRKRPAARVREKDVYLACGAFHFGKQAIEVRACRPIRRKHRCNRYRSSLPRRMRHEELVDLYAFLTVAKEQSFTRAAVRLSSSQSALSHTIRQPRPSAECNKGKYNQIYWYLNT